MLIFCYLYGCVCVISSICLELFFQHPHLSHCLRHDPNKWSMCEVVYIFICFDFIPDVYLRECLVTWPIEWSIVIVNMPTLRWTRLITKPPTIYAYPSQFMSRQCYCYQVSRCTVRVRGEWGGGGVIHVGDKEWKCFREQPCEKRGVTG